MEFLSRLLGATYTPRKTPPAKPVNDAQSRLTRYNRVLSSITQLCDNRRDLSREDTTLNELQSLFERLTQIIRDESRAAQPHPCVQYASQQQVYALVNRAASISFHQGCIRAAIALMSALVDSEEQIFLTNRGFAKSLMRLVMKVVDREELELAADTESSILELLFIIAAKIRLQPEILSTWFTLTKRVELEFDDEKTPAASLGLTRSEDFPLCFILVDRIYKEGRTGDFARTALLYLFEATSKSNDLAIYMVESSICTLMASGLGALYSQLSRELSILHPDAVLPPVLAMSDYTTMPPTRLSAESAFNDVHIAHMTTFISYLYFWVDILDHVKRDDVKQALLDNFEILFLQQLLYPSILQSSDIDAGSAIAILTYIEAIVSGIEHPALMDTILSYILAVDRKADAGSSLQEKRAQEAEQSPIALSRRESLLAMTQSGTLEDIVEPTLFTLADLIQNSLESTNSQTLFAALRLSSTIIRRQSKYAFGTMLKLSLASAELPKRTLGMVKAELEHYTQLAQRLHSRRLEAALTDIVDDTRLSLDALVHRLATNDDSSRESVIARSTILMDDGTFLPKLMLLLRGFFSNPVDVNLALTQTLIAITQLPQLRLDGWVCLHVPTSIATIAARPRPRAWQQHLDEEEKAAFSAIEQSSVEPEWPKANPPSLFGVLEALVRELETVRTSVPDLDALISARKLMLQVPGLDDALPGTISLPQTPVSTRTSSLPVREPPAAQGASSATLSPTRGLSIEGRPQSPSHASTALSSFPADRDPSDDRPAEALRTPTRNRVDARQIFQPPPNETPSTTDVLMQKIELPSHEDHTDQKARNASLNHVLTNAVVLQEFVLEIVAILQVRASSFANEELRVD